jgi:hypothetical protein
MSMLYSSLRALDKLFTASTPRYFAALDVPMGARGAIGTKGYSHDFMKFGRR